MQSFWKAAVAACGLGALATFLFWSLYARWLTLPVLAKLTKRQLFRLFLVFLIATFLFASLALGTYGWLQTQDKAVLRHSKTELIGMLKARETQFSSAMQSLQITIRRQERDNRQTHLLPRDLIAPLEKGDRTSEDILPVTTSSKDIDDLTSVVRRLNQQRIAALESDNLLLYHDLSNSINDLKIKYQLASAESRERLQHFREMVRMLSTMDPIAMGAAQLRARAEELSLTKTEAFLRALHDIMADNN